VTGVGLFYYLPMKSVHYGRGSVSALLSELDQLGASRVMIVTSPSVGKDPRLVPRIEELLGNRCVAVWDGVRAHVPYECLQSGLDMLIEQRPDVLVTVGAGSVVDAGRALALAAGERLASASELAGWRATIDAGGGTAVLPRTSGNALPIIAISTTISAAEFANCAAVTATDRGTKDLLIADELTPRSVILDPELGVTTPPEIWVSTGMRAIDHAIETVYSAGSGPVTDALALDAIARLPQALRATIANPDDVEARGEAQVAAWESYFGEMNLTLGLSHAIGHQIGARHGVQHGWTSCVVLPSVMRWLAPVTAAKQERIARALGVDTSSMTHAEAAEAAARTIEALVVDLRLPSRLGELGVAREHYAGLAEAVLQDLVLAGSPRKAGYDDLVHIFEQCA
jgi:alcohol dehydrogenase